MIARLSQNPIFIVGAALLCGFATTSSGAAESGACASDDSGLSLPPGFCASVFADGIGHARHLVVSSKGVVYANTWSGRYFGNDKPHEGGFLVAMQDTKGSGKADRIERFGETVESGGHGGTGIGLYKDFLYAESNDKIVKYKFDSGSIVPNVSPTTVVSGLPLTGDHPMHPFVIDGSGSIILDVASATNSCQEKNRTLKSPGIEPCVEQETRGGVWRYSATKTDQVFSSAARYVTGIRNAEGFGIDGSGRVFATQHGRDQLHTNWPDVIKDADQEATIPSEEVVLLQNKGDYGWPKCYFNPYSNQLVLAPEYGGDGKTQGLCAQKSGPVAVFPAHWAPNDMVYAMGKQFPAAYRNGLFIAFHGSWNRAPYAQAGYNVVFQPMSGAKSAAACEIFADGFSGADRSPAKAEHRPTGLAFGPDGSLYVADDVRGRIYRITYRAGANSGGKTTACPSNTAPAGPINTAASRPPEGTNPDAGRTAPIPPGATAAMVALGDRIYHGESGATCTGCHGSSGSGSTLGPDLSSGKWLWSDGSPTGIAAIITKGVSDPKQYRSPMPAMGGAQLSADQVNAVAAYVWTLSHAAKAATSMNGADIAIPGEKIFPESLTSTSDGRVFIGSISERRIYAVKSGSKTAEPWTAADGDASRGIFGVFADEKANTLWACLSGFQRSSSQSALMAFDLKSGTAKSSYSLPTAGAFCNDIAVGADGTIYVSDSNNMEIDRLKSGDNLLHVWAGNGAFGPKGGTLDGIAVIGNRLFVNTLRTNKIFAVQIGADGSAGDSVDIKLDRAIENPDGMRSYGNNLLLIESGGIGRLAKLQISGGDTGQLTTLKEGFPGGPVSVAMVGTTGYVLEGQLKLMSNRDANVQAAPFHAVAVTVGSP
jgi:glucose/arabinose dehydrogenase/mono/diheme cytochrome c family protein